MTTDVHTSTIRLLLDGRKAIEIHGPADLTAETTDAIVNAANSSLLGGGGVDGAIHRAGGPVILAECRQIAGKIGTLPAGKAVITTGGRLAAKYVVHTVGPIYRGGRSGEAELLASCHRESLRLADQQGLASDGISRNLDRRLRISSDRGGAHCNFCHARSPLPSEARNALSLRAIRRVDCARL